jgi:hypothetical protein
VLFIEEILCPESIHPHPDSVPIFWDVFSIACCDEKMMNLDTIMPA